MDRFEDRKEKNVKEIDSPDSFPLVANGKKMPIKKESRKEKRAMALWNFLTNRGFHRGC